MKPPDSLPPLPPPDDVPELGQELPDPVFEASGLEVEQQFEEAQALAPFSDENLPEGTQLSDSPDLATRSYEPRELAREIAENEHGTTPRDGQWEHHIVPLNEETLGANRARDLLDEAGVSLHSPENIASLPDTRDVGFGLEPVDAGTLHNEIHSAEFRDSYADQIADRLESTEPDQRGDELASINADLYEGRIEPISSEPMEALDSD